MVSYVVYHKALRVCRRHHFYQRHERIFITGNPLISCVAIYRRRISDFLYEVNTKWHRRDENCVQNLSRNIYREQITCDPGKLTVG